MVQVRETLAEARNVNIRISVQKEVAAYVYRWFSVPLADGKQKNKQEKGREMEAIRLVSDMLSESAKLKGQPIEFMYKDYDGKQHIITVSPDVAGISQQRQQRKRKTAEGSSGEIGTPEVRRQR